MTQALIIQSSLFDYDALDAETRIVVQQRTSEIKTLMRRSAQDIIDIGQKLIEVKARLGHGHFGGWLESEFSWTQMTATRFMNVAETFKFNNLLDLEIAPSALYALAAPSTPEPVRAEAIERAQAGEPITYSTAKAIIEERKARQISPVVTNGNGYCAPVDERENEDDDGEFDWSEDEDWQWEYEPEESPAYCKYCYGTHADWEIGDDFSEPTWICQRCDHATLDKFMDIREWDTPPKMAVHFSSETPEHYTPREIIDAVTDCMGKIDLDPCSNSHESPNIPARYHFTQDDDGLAQMWLGKVYMNPPYGREIVEWVEKLVKSHEGGEVEEAIALVPARTDTQWWALLRDYPVCFVRGRLKFGGAENGAPFPSAVFYLGDEIDKFYYSFCGIGDIWQRVEPGMFGE